MGRFCLMVDQVLDLLVEFHHIWSVPAACAAGFFLSVYRLLCFDLRFAVTKAKNGREKKMGKEGNGEDGFTL